MNKNLFLNSKTWVISNNLFLYNNDKNVNHIDDLKEFIDSQHLNINVEDVFSGSLILAKMNNVVVINDGNYLIVFLPIELSNIQRDIFDNIRIIFENFDKIFIAKMNFSDELNYDSYENENENISDVDYLYHLINSNVKIKKLA